MELSQLLSLKIIIKYKFNNKFNLYNMSLQFDIKNKIFLKITSTTKWIHNWFLEKIWFDDWFFNL